jgi:preprotein translocase subunit YajC
MTLIHWLQTIWFVSIGVVFSQMFFVRRVQKRLNQQSEILAAAVAKFTNAALSGGITGVKVEVRDATNSQTDRFDA